MRYKILLWHKDEDYGEFETRLNEMADQGWSFKSDFDGREYGVGVMRVFLMEKFNNPPLDGQRIEG